MSELQALSEKVDKLQNTLDMFIRYTVERDSNSFMADVESNLYADMIFEMLVNPDSFFDVGRG